MKALLLTDLKTPATLVERDPLTPGQGEVVVDLRSAALNRRDYWITQGMYPGIQLPVVLGSDGAGVVSQVGRDVDSKWLDRDVIINPGWGWGDRQAAQSDEFRVLGMPDDGTFAEQVIVPQEYLYDKPAHLNWQQAAALPLAGITAYRAVFTQGRLRENESILISGVGGGVAGFALQFAVAARAKTLVTSSSPQKIADAVKFGAIAGFDYSEEKWQKGARTEHGMMDLIVDGAGGAGYGSLLDLATPGGRIVNYGSTAGAPPKVDLFKVFWKQLQILGSTMGSDQDFQEMLEFVERKQLCPIVDRTYSLAEGNAAIESMRNSQQFGKIVIDIS